MSDNQFQDNEEFLDLDFDEKSEIEKLQATIRSMSNNFTDDSEGFLSQSPAALLGNSSLLENAEVDPYAAIEKPVVRSNSKAKKFVVMVDSENVNFFEQIPLDERTKIFNSLLVRYQKEVTSEKRKKKFIKISKHSLLGMFVIMISLPIMFLIVNKSIELTIRNYKDVQNNFEKLYESRNQGSFSSSRRVVY